MKSRIGWLALVIFGLALAVQATRAQAEGEEKTGEGEKTKRPRGGIIGMLLTVEKIEERLGDKFTDEQKTKITAKRDEVKKKIEDAKEDKEAGRAAIEEYKKFLGELLGADKLAKIFPPRKEGKTGEAKTGDAPKEEKKTEAGGGDMK